MTPPRESDRALLPCLRCELGGDVAYRLARCGMCRENYRRVAEGYKQQLLKEPTEEFPAGRLAE